MNDNLKKGIIIAVCGVVFLAVAYLLLMIIS